MFAIAGGIGVPISLDEATSKKSFGHFARVLVDIDLKGDIQDQILVEKEGFAFFVGLKYENLPQFCNNCQVIGHSLVNCTKNSTNEATNQDDTVLQRSKLKNQNMVNRRPILKYVPKARRMMLMMWRK